MTLPPERVPAATLLHPLSVSCLLVLVVNDHVLKRACPGIVTGKLSDFSGLFLLPLFLHALFELVYARCQGKACSPRLSRGTLALSAIVSAAGFALAELGGLGETSYRFGLAALQWPLRALFALAHWHALPALAPVRATADLSDLIALPMAFFAYRIGRRDLSRNARGELGSRRSPQGLRRLRSLLLLFGATLTLTLAVGSRAFATETQTGNSGAVPVIGVTAEQTPPGAEPVPHDTSHEPRGAHRHDGFYLAFDLGGGAAWLDSNASISNGFRQPIASSARGFAFPTGGLSIGGTLPVSGMGLVLGVRMGMGEIAEPVIHTLGETFRVPNLHLQLVELQAIAKIYPDPRRGFYMGAGAGGMSVERSGQFSGEFQRGFSLSLEGGHEFWVLRQWSLGVGGRLTVGRVNGDEFGHTTLLVPALFGNVVFH